MKKNLSILLVAVLFTIPAISESTVLTLNVSPTESVPPIIIPPYKIAGMKITTVNIQQLPESFLKPESQF